MQFNSLSLLMVFFISTQAFPCGRGATSGIPSGVSSGAISGMPSGATYRTPIDLVESFVENSQLDQEKVHQAIRGNCPQGYIFVPGNASYNTPTLAKNFCVMKYLASNSGNGKASSTMSGAPWIGINRPNAAAACAANGDGYHLITNA